MQTTNEALWKDFASNDFNSPPLCSHLEGARPRHLALYRPRNQKTLDDTAPSWMSNPPSESVVCYFDTRKADNCSPKCVEAYIEHLEQKSLEQRTRRDRLALANQVQEYSESLSKTPITSLLPGDLPHDVKIQIVNAIPAEKEYSSIVSVMLLSKSWYAAVMAAERGFRERVEVLAGTESENLKKVIEQEWPSRDSWFDTWRIAYTLFCIECKAGLGPDKRCRPAETDGEPETACVCAWPCGEMEKYGAAFHPDSPACIRNEDEEDWSQYEGIDRNMYYEDW